MINIAALKGTTSTIEIRNNYGVLIRKDNGTCVEVNMDVFNDLYYIVSSQNVVALAKDCIEFTFYSRARSLNSYPEWYVEAVMTNYIFNIGGTDFIYTESGEEAMSDDGVVLRNMNGDIKYIERSLFDEMYEY